MYFVGPKSTVLHIITVLLNTYFQPSLLVYILLASPLLASQFFLLPVENRMYQKHAGLNNLGNY